MTAAPELHGSNPPAPAAEPAHHASAGMRGIPSIDRLKRLGPWVAYVAVALVCGYYFNERTDIVPKWGDWWAADPHAYILLQERAFLAGRFALIQHPAGAAHDYFWGRGGMHTSWGLGLPILALPLHLVGRLFGAQGCPDSVRFLLFYALTYVILARALHGLSRYENAALGASCGAAAFVLTFPTFVGMVASRFQIYEQTIAVGALWSVLLLAGVLALLHECTPRRLVMVCAAAGFGGVIRIPLAFYGPPTAGLALIIAHKRGLTWRHLATGLGAYVGMAALYFVGNVIRFGGALNSGYENCLCSAQPNRLTRWGLPFEKVPFLTAAKEMYATFFKLTPLGSQIFWPPPEVAPYAVGERWREYYAPTFDREVLFLWFLAGGIALWRLARGRLWHRDRDLRADAAAVVGAWSIFPALILFVFYARISNWCTRYATDLYPAFAASALSVGMFVVEVVRERVASLRSSAQIAMAGIAALYMSGWRGWVTHLSTPIDAKTLAARVAEIDAHGMTQPRASGHYKCGEPRGTAPVFTHFDEWRGDCFYSSGMAFALPYSPCVTFTFGPGGATWSPEDEQALEEFRVDGDFDRYKLCGAPSVEGASRHVTMCETKTPPFLVDGLRLYTIGSIKPDLTPNDRLRLLQVDASTSCK